MNGNGGKALLAATDLSPVQISNPDGSALFLLIGDHAGNAVPAQLGRLGLPMSELHRHIGIDLGVQALGEVLATRLDAPFIAQAYSRLVIDCNRSLDDPGSIVAESDGTLVPGNHDLSAADRAARVREIFDPYHAAIAAALGAGDRSGRLTTLVSLHSFTPTLQHEHRPWEIGVLYDGGDARFARCLLAELAERSDLCLGDNQPYQMDATDFTVPHHAYPASRPYVELEVRQDVLADPARHADIASLLGDALVAAAAATQGPA